VKITDFGTARLDDNVFSLFPDAGQASPAAPSAPAETDPAPTGEARWQMDDDLAAESTVQLQLIGGTGPDRAPPAARGPRGLTRPGLSPARRCTWRPSS